MKPTTYPEIAELFGVELCQARFGSDDRNHLQGDASPQPPTIHWIDRAVTTSGVRRFLMFVAAARWPDLYREGPRWMQIYRQNCKAVELSRIIGRRLGQRTYSAADRERVRYLLRRVNPRSLNSSEFKTYTKAARWMNRF
jgi:hypothetical protein